MNNQKLFRLLRIAALLTALSLFAELTFEAFHTGHEAACHEEDCPVCLVLQIIHNTEKIGQNTVSASVEFTSIFYINIILLSALLLAPATLVKQKVKLVI
ncbi:hypothetical protein SAMN04487977_101218 [Treponema bryantii]|uniref:Uncharacterized protein n=1 Tax=Treponema bryantii TaxID=163 RepID=A0A1H9A666_9SPIR|nr:hypothetical protein [Treponema bryantii]SEP72115.1 hypothetical protein SAMN04487977_101218 [Treponema bryantii]